MRLADRLLMKALLVIAMLSATAAAEPPRLGGSVGLGAPFGELGIEYTQPVLDHVELGLGSGLARGGVQAFVMPRLKTTGRLAFDIGVGASVGRYKELNLCRESCTPERSAMALWANGEVGLRASATNGVFIRFAVGVGVLTARGACSSGQTSCGFVEPGVGLPSFGLTVGSTL